MVNLWAIKKALSLMGSLAWNEHLALPILVELNGVSRSRRVQEELARFRRPLMVPRSGVHQKRGGNIKSPRIRKKAANLRA